MLGTFKNMANRSVKEVAKAIRGLTKQVQKHRDKISNPRKYVPEWDTWDDARKCKQLRDWRNEVQGWEEQIEVLKGLPKELGG